jgi:hypothetical protein
LPPLVGLGVGAMQPFGVSATGTALLAIDGSVNVACPSFGLVGALYVANPITGACTVQLAFAAAGQGGEAFVGAVDATCRPNAVAGACVWQWLQRLRSATARTTWASADFGVQLHADTHAQPPLRSTTSAQPALKIANRAATAKAVVYVRQAKATTRRWALASKTTRG